MEYVSSEGPSSGSETDVSFFFHISLSGEIIIIIIHGIYIALNLYSIF